MILSEIGVGHVDKLLSLPDEKVEILRRVTTNIVEVGIELQDFLTKLGERRGEPATGAEARNISPRLALGTCIANRPSDRIERREPGTSSQLGNVDEKRVESD
jgi:hypothetical protein